MDDSSTVAKMMAQSMRMQSLTLLLTAPNVTMPISLRKKILYELLKTAGIGYSEDEQNKIEKWYSVELKDPRRELS